MRSGGSDPTNSDSSRAGTVRAPSPSTCPPTHVLMATSRFVADSFRRDWSVSRSTFWVMGSVVAGGDGPGL